MFSLMTYTMPEKENIMASFQSVASGFYCDRGHPILQLPNGTLMGARGETYEVIGCSVQMKTPPQWDCGPAAPVEENAIDDLPIAIEIPAEETYGTSSSSVEASSLPGLQVSSLTSSPLMSPVSLSPREITPIPISLTPENSTSLMDVCNPYSEGSLSTSRSPSVSPPTSSPASQQSTMKRPVGKTRPTKSSRHQTVKMGVDGQLKMRDKQVIPSSAVARTLRQKSVPVVPVSNAAPTLRQPFASVSFDQPPVSVGARMPPPSRPAPVRPQQNGKGRLKRSGSLDSSDLPARIPNEEDSFASGLLMTSRAATQQKNEKSLIRLGAVDSAIILASFCCHTLDDMDWPDLFQNMSKSLQSRLLSLPQKHRVAHEKLIREVGKRLQDVDLAYEALIAEVDKTREKEICVCEEKHRSLLAANQKQCDKDHSNYLKQREEMARLAVKKAEEARKSARNSELKVAKQKMGEEKTKIKEMKKTMTKNDLKKAKHEIAFRLEFEAVTFDQETARQKAYAESKSRFASAFQIGDTRLAHSVDHISSSIQMTLAKCQALGKACTDEMEAMVEWTRNRVRLVRDTLHDKLKAEMMHLEECKIVEKEVGAKAMEARMKQRSKDSFGTYKTLMKKKPGSPRKIDDQGITEQEDCIKREIEREWDLVYHYRGLRMARWKECSDQETSVLNSLCTRMEQYCGLMVPKKLEELKEVFSELETQVLHHVASAFKETKLAQLKDELATLLIRFEDSMKSLLQSQEDALRKAFDEYRNSGGFRSKFECDTIVEIENIFSTAEKEVELILQEERINIDSAEENWECRKQKEIATAMETLHQVVLEETERVAAVVKEYVCQQSVN